MTWFLSLRGLLSSSKHAVTRNVVCELLLKKTTNKQKTPGEGRHCIAMNPQELRERSRAHNLHSFSTFYAAQFYVLFNPYNNTVKWVLPPFHRWGHWCSKNSINRQWWGCLCSLGVSGTQTWISLLRKGILVHRIHLVSNSKLRLFLFLWIALKLVLTLGFFCFNTLLGRKRMVIPFCSKWSQLQCVSEQLSWSIFKKKIYAWG